MPADPVRSEVGTNFVRMTVSSDLSTPRTAHTLNLIHRNRRKVLEIVDGLSPEQMTKIPAGFRNHMLWNVGHLAVALQNLCYKMSGLPVLLPADAGALFGKGTAPTEWGSAAPDPETVKAWLLPGIEALERDIARGLFTTYTPYETSMGNVLTSLPEALDHVLWHEGLHFGTLLAMRKLV
jgi:hypothetical protein